MYMIINTCPSFVKRDLLHPLRLRDFAFAEPFLHRIVFTLGITIISTEINCRDRVSVLKLRITVYSAHVLPVSKSSLSTLP
jgi:hypothetical protein